ncbi:MAG TPA: hypothetical protein VGK20_06705 [Candidatus Binatia bacterium]|jgi:hypothetical protein
MFAGHYTSAFVAKSASPRTPLWILLVAAQFVDFLWVFAILSGVEQARLDASLASNPLVLSYMPWTHSLVASLVWSAVAFLLARRLLALATGESVLVAAVVLSHWFLDLVVHRPDLTIAGGDYKLGFALWNHPIAAWLLEVALVIASIAMAMRAATSDASQRRRWLWLGGALVVLQTATSFGPLPASITALGVSTLTIYVAVAYAGYRVEA